MKKLKLSTALDGIFVFLLSFFIIYALVKGSVKGVFLTTLISILCSLVITLSFCLLMENKNSKKDVTLKQLKEYDDFLRSLFFYSDKEVLKIIKSYYVALGLKCVERSGYLLIEEKKIQVYFSFTPEKTDLKTIISAYKKTPKGYSTVFFYNDCDSSAREFFGGFDKVKLFSAKDLYLQLKEKNILPEIKSTLPKKKKIKTPVKEIFKRENSKKFFALGAMFLLFSTVTYFKWFYLVLGIGFLTVSSYLRFFKNFKEKEKAELL